MDHGSRDRERSWFSTRANIALIGFLALAGFYLVTEHSAHLLGWLPWLLLLACPVLHLFMHGGHGDHAGNDGRHAEGRANGTSPVTSSDREHDHE